MKMYIDFGFNNDVEADTQAIQIATGKFKGVVFRFKEVGIQEAEDSAVINFEYDLVDTVKFKKSELDSDKSFQVCLGEILNSILTDSFKDDDEDRKDYFEEPVA
jgi:hypothetical protein